MEEHVPILTMGSESSTRLSAWMEYFAGVTDQKTSIQLVPKSHPERGNIFAFNEVTIIYDNAMKLYEAKYCRRWN